MRPAGERGFWSSVLRRYRSQHSRHRYRDDSPDCLPRLWEHRGKPRFGVVADIHVHPGGYTQSASPPVILLRAICRMRARSSAGIGSRPRRDFHRQKIRKPARCQAIKVLGFTRIRTSRQLNRRGRKAIRNCKGLSNRGAGILVRQLLTEIEVLGR